MWGLQSIAEEIYNLFWILNFCQPVRVSTDKWARVSWLLCCVPVPPLSGIFGIDSPTKMGSTILPARVGWLLYVVSILSLGSLGLIPKFFSFHHKHSQMIGSTILSPRVGWLLRQSCVHPLSLGSLKLTLPNRWEAQVCRPELVCCYVVSKL